MRYAGHVFVVLSVAFLALAAFLRPAEFPQADTLTPAPETARVNTAPPTRPQ